MCIFSWDIYASFLYKTALKYEQPLMFWIMICCSTASVCLFLRLHLFQMQFGKSCPRQLFVNKSLLQYTDSLKTGHNWVEKSLTKSLLKAHNWELLNLLSMGMVREEIGHFIGEPCHIRKFSCILTKPCVADSFHTLIHNATSHSHKFYNDIMGEWMERPWINVATTTTLVKGDAAHKAHFLLVLFSPIFRNTIHLINDMFLSDKCWCGYCGM